MTTIVQSLWMYSAMLHVKNKLEAMSKPWFPMSYSFTQRVQVSL